MKILLTGFEITNPKDKQIDWKFREYLESAVIGTTRAVPRSVTLFGVTFERVEDADSVPVFRDQRRPTALSATNPGPVWPVK